MTHHHIRSKLHILRSGVCAYENTEAQARKHFMNGKPGYSFPTGTPVDDIMARIKGTPLYGAAAQDNIARMSAASNYCIDTQVVELLRRPDVVESVQLLVDHNLARLPVSPMTLEFNLVPEYHEIVHLEEIGFDPLVLRVRYGTMELATLKAMICAEPMELDVAYMENLLRKINVEREGFSLHDLYKHGSQLVVSIIVAIRTAILMLNTLGIEREVVEAPTKLNKARAKHGKEPISGHTLIHIGRIFRRDGSSVKNEYGSTGRSMPMHIRQAHVRHVPYGPMKGVPQGDRPTRLTLIPMCIVNFDPALPEPTVQKEIRA